jgi:N-methylhydantoinase A/oxoprolinase/acetone carboxylase beta subunit
METKLIDRATLRRGQQFEGPAIVFQYDTTTVVGVGWQARVDRFGNLVLRAETGD